MKYVITWTSEALSTYEERIEYLKYIGQKKKTNFKKRVNEYLEIFKEKPPVGKNTGKFKNVHICLIIKQVSLIYRVNTAAKEIQLISFIDNRQNPGYIRKHRV
ncbi:MAG TPA: hypothetical protein VGN20_20815 [Mucilaginibacter sp.]|jgi:hypothetical protein